MSEQSYRAQQRPPSTLHLATGFVRAHPGWYVFPVAPGEKLPPCIKDNLNLASDDPRQLAAWHAKWWGCNWGLAPGKSRIIPMDVDLKPGKIGQDTLDMLQLEYGRLPPTLTVRTPSNGLHLYFNETSLAKYKFALGKSGFGADIDCPAYVLIPGCRIAAMPLGYRIVRNLPVANAPDWFADFLTEKAKLESADQEPVVDLDTPAAVAWAIRYLIEGAPPSLQGSNGEYTLLCVAAVLKDYGISETTAVALIDEHYNVPGRCEPQWNCGYGADADNLVVKVRNAYTYARQNAPGAGTAEAHFAGDPVLPEEVAALATNWRKRDFDQEQAKLRQRNERQQRREKRRASKHYVLRDGVRVPVVRE